MNPNHSDELEAAANSVNVTVDLLQWEGTDEAQRTAAARLVQLSRQLRSQFGLDAEPIDEQEIVFWQHIRFPLQPTLKQADLTARQLAHFDDTHMKMIRNVGADMIRRIRYAMERAQLRSEPDVERGIMTAKLCGIQATSHLRYCPDGMRDLTVGDVRRLGEGYISRTYTLNTAGQKYIRALARKVQRLA